MISRAFGTLEKVEGATWTPGEFSFHRPAAVRLNPSRREAASSRAAAPRRRNIELNFAELEHQVEPSTTHWTLVLLLVAPRGCALHYQLARETPVHHVIAR